MARRAEHLPTHYERVVLQRLSTSAEMSARNLDPGGRTLSKLLAKGWIERGTARHYRITLLGEAALRMPMR
jgi:hypothetical protein